MKKPVKPVFKPVGSDYPKWRTVVDTKRVKRVIIQNGAFAEVNITHFSSKYLKEFIEQIQSLQSQRQK